MQRVMVTGPYLEYKLNAKLANVNGRVARGNKGDICLAFCIRAREVLLED